MASSFSLDQPWLSRSFPLGLWLLSLSFLYLHFHLAISRSLFPCLDPVRHSGPLGFWHGASSSYQPSLAALPLSCCSSSLLPSILSVWRTVGHSGPLYAWPDWVFSFLSYSVLLTLVYSLYACDPVASSPDPWVRFVSSFFSARRPVAMGIQSDLRCVATNVDPK